MEYVRICTNLFTCSPQMKLKFPEHAADWHLSRIPKRVEGPIQENHVPINITKCRVVSYSFCELGEKKKRNNSDLYVWLCLVTKTFLKYCDSYLVTHSANKQTIVCRSLPSRSAWTWGREVQLCLCVCVCVLQDWNRSQGH
jgi:hypothetical protein